MNTAPALRYTEPARQALNQYFRSRLAPGRLEGADPAELQADLQAHLEEELLRNGTGTVTLEELRLALARMGETWTAADDTVDAPVAGAKTPEQKIKRWRWLWLGGVFLPLVAFVFEVVTRGCAGVLFDVMPDVFHHALVLLVPAAAWSFWRSRTSGAKEQSGKRLPVLVGAAFAVTVYYSLCMLPVSVAAVGAIIWFGVGLLALSPFFACLAIRSAWKHMAREGDPGVVRTMRWSCGTTFALILAFGFPTAITKYGIHQAVEAEYTSDPARRSSAVQLIRKWGSAGVLLRACYATPFNFRINEPLRAGPVFWLADWVRWIGVGHPVAAERLVTLSRELHWQVTGQPFNLMPRPVSVRPWMHSIFNPLRNRLNDRDRGGLTVAGRIDGLTLQEGRMDWHCEQASGLCWGEWTMTFSNATADAEEARCRIALPPGGFVSRVTLWVEGQPQEAAFSTVAKVRSAYQSVAVVQKRDPVLVTQPDAGSILVQAFPVPPGGVLKTRLTFTAPAGSDSRVWLPAITEQNFGMADGVLQKLWVQADGGSLQLPQEFSPHPAMENGCPTVTASLPAKAVSGLGTSFVWNRKGAPTVYCQDILSGAASRWVVGTPRIGSPIAPAAVAWVVDTSAPMAQHQSALAALGNSFSGVPNRLFLPGDHSAEMEARDDFRIAATDFSGGRDNAPALAAAFDWLRDKPQGALIWIHGPQPAASPVHLNLEQLLERSMATFTLLDVPLIPGENHLSPLFQALARVRVLPVRLQPDGLAVSLDSALTPPVMDFQIVPAEPISSAETVRTGDSLARWYARLEAGKLGLHNAPAASTLASSYQIVSPWSGAVVLEKAADYEKHQLTQSNAAVSQIIPAIPEPSSLLLLVLSMAPFLTRRRRRS